MKNKNHFKQQVAEFVKQYAYKSPTDVRIYVNCHYRPNEQVKEIQYLIKHNMVIRVRDGIWSSRKTYYKLNEKGLALISNSGVYDVRHRIS